MTPQMFYRHPLGFSCVSNDPNSEGNLHPPHWSENSSSISVCLKESREFPRPRTARLSSAPADPSAKTQETQKNTQKQHGP